MIHDPQHSLTQVEVTGPAQLRLSFADGAEHSLDLAPVIRAYPALAPLADAVLFAAVRLDARGGYLVWREDEL